MRLVHPSDCDSRGDGDLRHCRDVGILRGHKSTHEVFGVSNTVLPDSYVDRGELDEELRRYLERSEHIALRGATKCGKSWLRQTVLPKALIVQCRLKKTTLDIYRDALSQLEIRLEVESTSGTTWKAHVETQGDLGVKLLARLGVRTAVDAERAGETTTQMVGHDITDLRFIADLLRESARRLVIEDFHYLSVAPSDLQAATRSKTAASTTTDHGQLRRNLAPLSVWG